MGDAQLPWAMLPRNGGTPQKALPAGVGIMPPRGDQDEPDA